MAERRKRLALIAAIMGSFVAGLDATAVNVALPAIRADLGGGLAGQQWISNAYLLALGSLILVGGSLGDRHGRRRIFVLGVGMFTGASLLCAIAPNAEMLIFARLLQGVGGALLTPGSLAMIESSFRPGDRARAIGAWSGLGGVAAALGPLLGGYLVDAVSWRAIFLINLPLGIFVIVAAGRHVSRFTPITSSRPPSSVPSRRRTRNPADEATKLLAGHPPIHDTRQPVVARVAVHTELTRNSRDRLRSGGHDLHA